MALVKFGGGIVDMRGSIAGNVFSRNTFGNYVRARTVPVNPNTSRQQKVKNAMAALADAWSNTLTPAERTAWGLYAANIEFTNKLGETILLSGFNHYMRSNIARLNVDVGRVDAGPTVLSLPESDSAFNVVANVGAQTLTVTFDDTRDWAGETGAYLILSMSQPKHSAVNFIGGPFRTITAMTGSAGSAIASPATIGNLPYVISADQVIASRGRITRADGRLSNHFQDSRTPTTA